MKNDLDKKDTWIPTPRYLCRKSIVLGFLKDLRKGTFLEVGIGSGDLILEIAQKGYAGIGTDLSEKSIKMAEEKLKK